MNEQSFAFDSEELMQLALRATENDQVEDAIGHLKRLLANEPDHASGIYLLAGLHAQIGLFDRAAQEMARAVELEPELWTAWFQLGLLQIRAGQFEEARETWAALDPLGDENPLFLFKRALLRFAEGEIADCILDLEKGIALNTDNDALNRDMANVKIEAEKALETFREAFPEEMGAKQPAANGANGEAKPPGRHALLSRYDEGDED